MMPPRHKNQPAALWLFSLTLFLSAALMFAIEPMIGKMLLPLVGGTPAGWIVAMAFFQVMLLLGYLYAHLLSRFPPRIHALLFIATLLAGMLFLPVKMPTTAIDGNPGPFDIFRLLTIVAAVPFIALSAASSTLQRLFTTTGHASSEDPYFLYAASNLGSFAGLFIYPFAFEPAFGLSDQARYWLYAFVALVALSASCLVFARGKKEEKPRDQRRAAPVTSRQRLEWIALAFFPSSILLGVTTHISTEIFSAPLIWVLPLAVYLLTFVIAFSRKPLIKFRTVATFQPIAVSLVVALLLSYNADVRISWYAVVFHLFAFCTVALMCHMRLAQLRPLGDGRQLTEFYLMISVGGALGGLLNAFIVPVVLDRLIEYPAMMILSCIMNPVFREKIVPQAKNFLIAGISGIVIYAVYSMTARAFIHGDDAISYTPGMVLADILLCAIAIIVAIDAKAVFCGMLALLMLSQFVIPRDVRLSERNFYGVVKVFDRPQLVEGKRYDVRFMVHGNTTHGLQVVDPKYEKTMTTYYWKGGPAGDVFKAYNPAKVAVIGLGAGTMNCYGSPKNEFTFLEIDPAVIEIASDPKVFTFLSACKAKRPARFIAGDGRLELNKLPEKFDLIALDAFSSDVIPTHLITLEALKVYLDHLNPSGIILLHISNRYFDLSRILAVNAHELGLQWRTAMITPEKEFFYAAASKWFVMTRRGVSLAPLNSKDWEEPAAEKDRRPWTDDYTNLLSTLNVADFGGSLR
ncbi:MAG: fused MFS/spermidine synthase [Alphaproteobacteria bacterium]